jgi:hypothetical protein
MKNLYGTKDLYLIENDIFKKLDLKIKNKNKGLIIATCSLLLIYLVKKGFSILFDFIICSIITG